MEMTNKFLKSSAKHDGNDLSSVVQQGGHWCICAWAFASAVTRDPKNLHGLKLGACSYVGRVSVGKGGPRGEAELIVFVLLEHVV